MKKQESRKAKAAAGSPAATPIETAEYLAALGWERLTMVFASENDGDQFLEREILSDPDGVLWLYSDWHGPGNAVVPRAERRRITRETACAMLAKASIPAAFQHDFTECLSPRLRLEDAIQETSAFLILLADSEGGQRYGNFSGKDGERLQAEISSLALRLGDELAAAFYTEEIE